MRRRSLALGVLVGTVAAVVGGQYAAAYTQDESHGTVTGTVRDIHGELVDTAVCIGAWNVDVEFAGSAFTADGTYALSPLAAGEYRIRFDDCGGEGLGRVWYEDGSSFNTATPVPVASGATVTGIDVVLDPGPMSNDYGTGTGENRANQVDCGSSDGSETVGLDDIGGTARTVRADVSESGEGYVVHCSDGEEDPLPGRAYAQGNASEMEGSVCGDGTANNPYPFDQWACITDDRNGDGLPDVKCRGYDDSANSADPENDADLESCLVPITG